MSSFGILIMGFGSVLTLTALAITMYLFVKWYQNRTQVRKLLERLEQQSKDIEHSSSSRTLEPDIGKGMSNLTVRDYASNPKLARYIDQYLSLTKTHVSLYHSPADKSPQAKNASQTGNGSSFDNQATVDKDDEEVRDKNHWLKIAKNWSENGRMEDLCKANLRGADLSGVDLRGANLTGAFLEDANMIGADLSQGTTLTRAHMTRTNLQGANLEGASMLGVELDFANLQDANMSLCDAYVSSFYRANMQRVDLSRTKMIGAKLQEAEASEAIFWKSELKEVDMRGCHLVGSYFKEAEISNADLSQADLSNADVQEANLYNCAFLGTTLVNTNLSRATVGVCDFEGAETEGAKLGTLYDTRLYGNVGLDSTVTSTRGKERTDQDGQGQ